MPGHGEKREGTIKELKQCVFSYKPQNFIGYSLTDCHQSEAIRRGLIAISPHFILILT